jgi:chaperone modulatory protein CbpM
VKVQASEWQWLDARETIAADELCRACRITAQELEEVIGYGVLPPLPSQPRVFAADWLMPLRAATQLRRDFDLDLFTMGLLLDYLHRIDELEREMRSLRAHLPSHEHTRRDGPAPWHETHASDIHEAHGARQPGGGTARRP